VTGCRTIAKRFATCSVGLLLLVCSIKGYSQQTKGTFKIKDNLMYITLPTNMPRQDLDNFIEKYNLRDLGLTSLMLFTKDDSLRAAGWDVKRKVPDIYVITKSISSPQPVKTKSGKNIFLPVATPEGWRVVGGNRLVFGTNRFREGSEFRREGDIVYFELKRKGLSKSERVRLAGSFTNWQFGAFPMTPTEDGWIVPVKLNPGEYHYKFIIGDHQWMTDPQNKLTENDGRGNVNSVFYVPNKKFELKGYEDAGKVVLSGSFNNWDRDELRMKKTDGGWSIDVFIQPGTHRYQYIVDGKTIDVDQNGQPTVVALGKPHIFTLEGFKDAERVTVAGNFNDWKDKELPMKKTDKGWTLPYVLGPGNYQYKFIVDGRWMTDPKNPAVVNNDEGDWNSFLVIEPNYTFRLKGHSSAKQVFLTGDFNDWSPNGLPMIRKGNEWVCTVYLGKGKHLYKFVVDGKWIRDPANRTWEENEHGDGNSLVWIDDPASDSTNVRSDRR
jgi:hypothetical protein